MWVVTGEEDGATTATTGALKVVGTAVGVADEEETAVEIMVRVTALVRVDVMVVLLDRVSSAETMVAAVAMTARRMLEICILILGLCDW